MEDELFLIELYKKFSYSLHIVLGISIIIFLILSWYFIVYFIIAKKIRQRNRAVLFRLEFHGLCLQNKV